MKLITILFYAIVLLILLPIITIYLLESERNPTEISGSVSAEQQLANRLIELMDRIKYAEMLSRDRKRDINTLKTDMNSLRETIKLDIINNNKNETNFIDLVNSLKFKGILDLLFI